MASTDEDAPVDELPKKRDGIVGTDVHLQPLGTTTRFMWAALAFFFLSLVGVFLDAYLGGPRALVAFLGWSILLSPLAALAALAVGQGRTSLGHKLSVESRGIVVKRVRRISLVIARNEFVEGWYSPQVGEVNLLRRNGNLISAKVNGPKAATDLLENIGVDASKRTMRIRLGAVDFLNAMTWLLGPIFAMYIGEGVGMAVNQRGAIGFPLAIVVFLLEFFLIRRIFGPAHLVIGADGIIVEQRFSKRFVPFEKIESVSTAHDHVTLHLLGGETVRAKARHLGDAERATIEQRVHDALAIRTGGLADPAALAALDRGNRSGTAWHEALRGIFDKNRGYRQATLTPEQIAAVIIDPAAPAERRIGAALALAHSGDPELKPKLRIATESSANQKLRVAFEAIAQGDLENDAIEEAAQAEAEMHARTNV